MFLKKANFFENLIPLSLEPEAEPMKYQTLQAKRQFRAGFFTKFAWPTNMILTSPLTRVSPARFFAASPFLKMPVLPLKTPVTTFLTNIETQITNNTKNIKFGVTANFAIAIFNTKTQISTNLGTCHEIPSFVHEKKIHRQPFCRWHRPWQKEAPGRRP